MNFPIIGLIASQWFVRLGVRVARQDPSFHDVQAFRPLRIKTLPASRGGGFLVIFYSLLAGFYVRYSQGNLSLVDTPETLSYTAMAYAMAMTISMISVGLYQRGLPFSAGLLVRVGLSFLIASVAMSVVFTPSRTWW